MQSGNEAAKRFTSQKCSGGECSESNCHTITQHLPWEGDKKKPCLQLDEDRTLGFDTGICIRHRLVPGQAASVFFTKMARFGQIPVRKVRHWLQSGYTRTSNNLKTALLRRGAGIRTRDLLVPKIAAFSQCGDFGAVFQI